jgi:hypothetical protein
LLAGTPPCSEPLNERLIDLKMTHPGVGFLWFAFGSMCMGLESDALFKQFSHRDSIRRTPQNDVELAPLEERGLVQRTMSGCWLLTIAGRQALKECSERRAPANSVPPIFVAEAGDGPTH